MPKTPKQPVLLHLADCSASGCLLTQPVFSCSDKRRFYSYLLMMRVAVHQHYILLLRLY